LLSQGRKARKKSREVDGTSSSRRCAGTRSEGAGLFTKAKKA
jgi:hypothetical protein